MNTSALELESPAFLLSDSPFESVKEAISLSENLRSRISPEGISTAKVRCVPN
jgi:hypothetical protein